VFIILNKFWVVYFGLAVFFEIAMLVPFAVCGEYWAMLLVEICWPFFDIVEKWRWVVGFYPELLLVTTMTALAWALICTVLFFLLKKLVAFWRFPSSGAKTMSSTGPFKNKDEIDFQEKK